MLQFLEKWTAAIGSPAICPNISAWRRRVCGDLTSAFDFENPVFGMPDLPDPGRPIGEPQRYNPVPADNVMPAQEPGTRRARRLQVQPNANLDGFSTGADGAAVANLSFSNNGPHVRKSSHFAVYDNRAATPAVVQYPAGFPQQYTVDPESAAICNKQVAGSIGIGDGGYDLTVVGPNRFLRRFTGDITATGVAAQATAAYYAAGFGSRPKLVLKLHNGGDAAVDFTVVANHYSAESAKIYRVRPDASAAHVIDPCASSGGWYDVSVTIGGDASWSRRYVGHLEDGRDSVTG